LQFGEPFAAAFDGEVAAGDHHAGAGAAHGCEQDLGEVLEALRGFDLDDDAEAAFAEFVQRREEVLDVAAVAREGQLGA
jgi:hypothetical protein